MTRLQRSKAPEFQHMVEEGTQAPEELYQRCVAMAENQGVRPPLRNRSQADMKAWLDAMSKKSAGWT